jgi:hypothetical protein
MSDFNVISQIGTNQGLDDTSTTQKENLGLRVRAYSPTYGEGEFIYLKGVASTVLGSVVLIKDDYSTSLVAARDKGALAVAMSANVANQWGWYQTRGKAVTKVGTIAANAPLYIAAGNVLDDAAVAGDQVIGARSVTADGTPSAGLAVVNFGAYAATADFDNA